MDNIDNLPIDKNRRPNKDEMEIMDLFFKQEKQSSSASEFKIVAFASLLYLLLSTSYFDKLVEFLPHTGSPLFKYATKAILFFAFLYVLLIITS